MLQLELRPPGCIRLLHGPFASRGLPNLVWMWKPLAIRCVEKLCSEKKRLFVENMRIEPCRWWIFYVCNVGGVEHIQIEAGRLKDLIVAAKFANVFLRCGRTCSRYVDM